jgi:hypothetical protein
MRPVVTCLERACGAVQRYRAIRVRATRRRGVGKQGIAWIATNRLSQRKG